jgi:protein tyrosine/serine phosphatase
VSVLAWKGCLNVRDLGGLPTEDGGTTRPGALVRADALTRLTPEGWRALAAHGVGRIIDLRFANEPASEPPADLAVEVVRAELMPDDEAYWSAVDTHLDAALTPAEHMVWLYVDLLELFPGRIARAVDAFADAGQGGVVVHCLVGKDRTGVVIALLLRIAGVPAEAVATDYSLSTRDGVDAIAEWADDATDDLARRRRTMRSQASPEVMLEFLEQVDLRYGGAEAYLRQAGVSEETLTRIRRRLRTD